ncbi:hypothetical protein vseg_018615 [Gypsophila vaccaria]
MKVRCGDKTRFWKDVWCDDMALRWKFNRLFSISTQKDDLVGQMGVWVEDNRQWKLCWRRNLFEWELELLGNLERTINVVNLQ